MRRTLLHWLAHSWVDRWLPERMLDGDANVLVWARLQASVCLMLLVAALGFAVGDVLTGLYALSVPLFVGAATTWVALLELRRTGDLGWSGNLLCGSAYLVTLGNAVVNGGLFAAVLLFMAVIPSLAQLFAGRPSARSWLVVVVLTIGALLGLHESGIELWQRMPEHMIAPNLGLVLIVLSVFLSGTSLLYQEIREWLLSQLEEAQADRTRRILDAAADSIVVVGADGRVASANRAARELLGLREEDPSDIEELLPGVMGGGRVVEVQRGEVTLPVEATVRPLGPERVLVLRDVSARESARRALEEARDHAQAASRSKSLFLASMSHELRTPLNAVIGYAEMMVDDVEAGEAVDCTDDLERIVGSARHLLALIDQILDLAKVESGKMELDLRTVDLGSLFDELDATGRTLARVRNNEWCFEADVDGVEAVLDPVRTRQVVLNLLSNASKFTEDGRIGLSVSLDEGGLLVAVEDTGIGMTEEQQERVWEEFVQAESFIAGVYGGTGLGLPLSRRLARLMGGELSLDSEADKGSTFRLTLPLEPVDAASLAQGGSLAG